MEQITASAVKASAFAKAPPINITTLAIFICLYDLVRSYIIYLNVINMENERVEQEKQETIKMEETREQPSRLEVIGAVISLGVLGLIYINPSQICWSVLASEDVV